MTRCFLIVLDTSAIKHNGQRALGLCFGDPSHIAIEYLSIVVVALLNDTISWAQYIVTNSAPATDIIEPLL